MKISHGNFCGFSECKYCDPENRDTEPGVCKTNQCDECGNLYDMEDFDKGLCEECDKYLSYGQMKRLYQLGILTIRQVFQVFDLNYTLKDEFRYIPTDELVPSCTGWNCRCQAPFGFGDGRNNICKYYGFEISEITEEQINKYYRFNRIPVMVPLIMY